MGKKKKEKVAKSSRGKSPSTITNTAVCKVVDELWILLQHSSSDKLDILLDEYDKIQSLIGRLKDLQTQQLEAEVLTGREDCLPKFEEWVQTHGVNYQGNVQVMTSSGRGLGIRLLRDIKNEEKVLEIPEKIMMTSRTAFEGVLGDLLRKDRMLQSMPNVSLALHLLNEKYSPHSFWTPYIEILPEFFSLPLYFTREELLLLRGSPCLVKSLLQVRNISKLYSHLHRMIRASGTESLPLFSHGFHYQDFVWAVSCVMSRQNEIPSKAGLPSPTLALIPLWDLCNHSSGSISTFFNVENSTCDCYANRNFSAHEEFTIFYGPRTNSEFLLQQGFVYPDNVNDTYEIKLGLTSVEEDATKTMRTELLKTVGLPMSGKFTLVQSAVPFSPDLCAFVRIFTADVHTLKRLACEEAASIGSQLRSTVWDLGDKIVLEFLEKRCLLLFQLYKSSIEEDEEQLKLESLSPCSRQAILLRLCEKFLLKNAIKYAKEMSQKLK